MDVIKVWLCFLTTCVLASSILAWQTATAPLSLSFSSRATASSSRLLPHCFGVKNNQLDIDNGDNDDNESPYSVTYTIGYSPNFQRHLVTRKVWNGTAVQKTVVKSFLWLDRAQQTFPNATLETLDLPPPPPLNKTPEAELVSRIVAGAGYNETSVYYADLSSLKTEGDGKSYKNQPASRNPNNGGTYLLRFLQKLYFALPTITPAEIHRGVMDKFPRLAFYDAAFVHERLFFLLAPLPPEPVLAELRAQSTSSATVKKQTKHSKTFDFLDDNENLLSHADDFPVLFYKYGYGAGISQSQLVQALQTLPQYWLPIYLSDASGAMKRPQDFLPYIFYHLKSHPDAMKDINNELDTLMVGVHPTDVASLAHAKSSLGLTWDQCRLLLMALPSLRSCNNEPSWELFNLGPVRSTLCDDSLAYLRLRLQLEPLQVYCLIKAHTRVSTYSIQSTMKRNLDALQRQLDFDSEEIQQLILRTPTALGMAASSFTDRLNFFTEEVGMTPQDVKKSVMMIPTLLQYSASNLQEKICFFRNELHITDKASLTRILVKSPMIFGHSLDRNLRPTALSLGESCGFSHREVGDIVVRVPPLLALNWKTNLGPKLDMLTERLQLTRMELKKLIMESPWILMQSITRSLNVKIEVIEKYFSQHGNSTTAVKEFILTSPTVLIQSKLRLAKRLGANSTKRGREKGYGATVLQLSQDGTVLREFPSVKEAANHIGTSRATMYRVIQMERIFQDCRFVKGTSPMKEYSNNVSRTVANEPSNVSVSVSGMLEATDVMGKYMRDIRRRHIDDDLERMLVHSLRNAKWNDTNVSCLSVYVSGRAYPSRPRGARRTGGMAISMPFLPQSFSRLFQQAFEECFQGQLLCTRSIQSELAQDSGLLALLGFPLLNPSRRRCGLYVCHVALRAIAQLFLLAGKSGSESRFHEAGDRSNWTSCPPPPTHIDIITDSSYVYDLLYDSARLLEWGSATSKADFVFTGEGSDWEANIDIVYPLSRTYYRLVNSMIPTSTILQKNLTISFVLAPEGASSHLSTFLLRERMGGWANEAAEWHFKRSLSRAKLST